MASNISVGCFMDCDQKSVEVNVEPHLSIVPPIVDSRKYELALMAKLSMSQRVKIAGIFQKRTKP